MKDKYSIGAPGDHLANERTFLAWIRTSIAMMGLGFVVVKFSIFIRQISNVLGTKASFHQTGDSQRIGILLVALGTVTIVFSFLRYHRTKTRLDLGLYYQSTLFIKLMTILIFGVSVLLIIYLITAISK
jgi:putative membrane protein